MLGEKRLLATIPVSDVGRSREFYEGVLGQKVVDETPDGALEYGQGFFTYPTEQNAGKSPATLASWEVEDLEATVGELRDKGVVLEEYDFPGLKTEEGIAELEGVKVAWFKDPDGNILNVTEGA